MRGCGPVLRSLSTPDGEEKTAHPKILFLPAICHHLSHHYLIYYNTTTPYSCHISESSSVFYSLAFRLQNLLGFTLPCSVDAQHRFAGL